MNHFSQSARDEEWHLTYQGFQPEKEKLRETLSTVGNGYFGTRGCYEGEKASETHYPGTYLAGLYNRLASTVHGKEIFNDDFVNCPNWLLIEYKIDDGDFVSPLKQEVLDYKQDLNMRDAIMSRFIRVKDEKGRITTIESHRFASMENPHYGAIRFILTPENYDAVITIRSGLDGTVDNNGVARYRNLSNKHLNPMEEAVTVDGDLYLHVETCQSRNQIVMCMANTLFSDGAAADVQRSVEQEDGFIAEQMRFEANRGKAYTLEKLVSISSSRDENSASPVDSARAMLARIESFDELLQRHSEEWHQLWKIADVRVEGDPFSQRVLRLHIYHLLSTASPHNIHIDAGMPARGLHGEAYRGHIFWDSLFVMPFYYQHFPEIARAGLMYRYRRLDSARNYAREFGFEGAMYPWQSADEGQEETQVIHYNPVSGNWDPDLSSRQRHVNIAIFYNIWEYYHYTADTEFLYQYGAEMLLEIARFWASISEYDKEEDRFHIRGVMGPDEFHEKYPDSQEGGLNDNAYTNIMVVWLLEKAIDIVAELPQEILDELSTHIRFGKEEMDHWRHITRRMNVPITKEGIISQFDGYMDLLELDLDHYRKKYKNIHRMDRILKSEGDSPDKYKVAKQADALMLFYVLTPDEVIRILSQLGYVIKDRAEFLRKNYEYYVNRTSHGSTLSKVVHASIAKQMSGREDMWQWFMEALESDIYDTQGGTTEEGIHCGVMAGTINIVNRVFAGVSYFKENIDIKPALPQKWKRLSFKLRMGGRFYSFEITKDDIRIGLDIDGEKPSMLRLNQN
ncbi:MAG: glycoside hydrolase family 65 protein [Chitinispirillaceae bacterium]